MSYMELSRKIQAEETKEIGYNDLHEPSGASFFKKLSLIGYVVYKTSFKGKYLGNRKKDIEEIKFKDFGERLGGGRGRTYMFSRYH